MIKLIYLIEKPPHPALPQTETTQSWNKHNARTGPTTRCVGLMRNTS